MNKELFNKQFEEVKKVMSKPQLDAIFNQYGVTNYE